ncbi:MAG: hypothetical protein ACI4BH_02110 [Muribaculaceae bacterium]
MEDQIRLFLSLQETDSIAANAVGRNFCLRNINNIDALRLYIDFCIEQINVDKNDMYSFFVDEAKAMCHYYLDNAIITSDSWAAFAELKNSLENRIKECTELLNQQVYKDYKSLIDKMKKCIDEYSSSAESSRVKYLEEIAELDSNIIVEDIPEDLRNDYTKLIQQVSDVTARIRKEEKKK